MTSSSMPIVLVISAPSGSGKTTVCSGLLAAAPGLARAITCTTRPPRPGERNGVDYRLLDPDTFGRRVAAGDVREHATVYGHRYGTLKTELFDRLNARRDVLLNVDVQGAAAVRAEAARRPDLAAALVTVFLAPVSIDTQAERRRSRGQDSESVIGQRLAAARMELERWREFDYLVVSGTMSEDLGCVQAIYTAEKLRCARMLLPPISEVQL